MRFFHQCQNKERRDNSCLAGVSEKFINSAQYEKKASDTFLIQNKPFSSMLSLGSVKALVLAKIVTLGSNLLSHSLFRSIRLLWTSCYVVISQSFPTLCSVEDYTNPKSVTRQMKTLSEKCNWWHDSCIVISFSQASYNVIGWITTP